MDSDNKKKTKHTESRLRNHEQMVTDRPKKVKPTEVTVRCNGQNHRIVWDGENIHFPGPPRMGLEETLIEFGRSCRCLDVRRAWQDRDRQGIPTGLLDAFDLQRMAKWRARYNRDLASLQPGTDLFYIAGNAMSVENGIKARRLDMARIQLIRDVQEALSRCTALLAPADLRGSHHNLIEIAASPKISGMRQQHLHSVPANKNQNSRRVHTYLRVHVGIGWSVRVYQPGLSVVEGRLVLGIVKPAEIDLWHQQSKLRGCPKPWWLKAFQGAPDFSRGIPAMVSTRGEARNVYYWAAYLVPKPKGTWTIDWVSKN